MRRVRFGKAWLGAAAIAALFAGSAALAQQGSVIDPWSQPVAQTMVTRVSSGLGPATSTELAPLVARATVAPAPRAVVLAQPWPPALVDGPIDPWASSRTESARVGKRASWALPLSDIVDPWQGQSDRRASKLASRPSRPPLETIF